MKNNNLTPFVQRMKKYVYGCIFFFCLLLMFDSCSDKMTITVTSKTSSITYVDTATGIWTTYLLTEQDTICYYQVDNTKIKKGEYLKLDVVKYNIVSELSTTFLHNDNVITKTDNYPFHYEYQMTEEGKNSIEVDIEYKCNQQSGKHQEKITFNVLP